jgi:hypothetical protein
MSESDFPINKVILYNEGLVLNQNDILVDNVKKLRILHFNDVYNIESRSVDPCGGASRFMSALEYLSKDEPTLVLFSGDAFSPSNCMLQTKTFVFPFGSILTWLSFK